MNVIEAVVVGASAGAIQALSNLLSQLPSTFRAPIVVVIHIPADDPGLIPELLQARSKLRVKEAEATEKLERGTVYIAPPNYHLMLERSLRLSLSVEDPVNYSRPSIDVLFESAAQSLGSRLAGVILTGANSDGAQGLRAICDAGGRAIVQNPETAFAPEMPLAALKMCPDSLVLELSEMGAQLVRIAEERLI